MSRAARSRAARSASHTLRTAASASRARSSARKNRIESASRPRISTHRVCASTSWSADTEPSARSVSASLSTMCDRRATSAPIRGGRRSALHAASATSPLPRCVTTTSHNTCGVRLARRVARRTSHSRIGASPSSTISRARRAPWPATITASATKTSKPSVRRVSASNSDGSPTHPATLAIGTRRSIESAAASSSPAARRVSTRRDYGGLRRCPRSVERRHDQMVAPGRPGAHLARCLLTPTCSRAPSTRRDCRAPPRPSRCTAVRRVPTGRAVRTRSVARMNR